jgi:hypothetical protein
VEVIMASQQRNMEGDNQQRRQKARDAREHDKRPSEVGATLGASKQRKEVSRQASHQERIETRREGKRGAGTSGKPKPGSRSRDPKRTDEWR